MNLQLLLELVSDEGGDWAPRQEKKEAAASNGGGGGGEQDNNIIAPPAAKSNNDEEEEKVPPRQQQTRIEYRRQYYAKNKQRISMNRSMFNIMHPDRIRAYNASYKAAKKVRQQTSAPGAGAEAGASNSRCSFDRNEAKRISNQVKYYAR